jgi:hypothetical protein
MTADSDFEIFLVAVPGLEGPLCAETRAKGFKARSTPSGVTRKGGRPEVPPLTTTYPVSPDWRGAAAYCEEAGIGLAGQRS